MASNFESTFDIASSKLLDGCLTLDRSTSRGKAVQIAGITWRLEDERRNSFAAFYLCIGANSVCNLVEDWRVAVTVPEMRCGTIRRVLRETLVFDRDTLRGLLYIASEDEVGYGLGDCYGTAFACKIIVRPRGLFLQCDVLDETPQRVAKDYFTDPNLAPEMMSDCRLILDDYTPIHVNKQHLAIYSKYFRLLFFGDFAEKYQNDIPLGGISKADLIKFLRCVYQPHELIDNSNVEPVLRLADRFECNFLITECVEFLLKRNLGSLEEVRKYIELADRCNLPQVLDSALNRAEFRVLPELLDPDWLHSLSVRTMDRVLERARETFRR